MRNSVHSSSHEIMALEILDAVRTARNTKPYSQVFFYSCPQNSLLTAGKGLECPGMMRNRCRQQCCLLGNFMGIILIGPLSVDVSFSPTLSLSLSSFSLSRYVPLDSDFPQTLKLDKISTNECYDSYENVKISADFLGVLYRDCLKLCPISKL